MTVEHFVHTAQNYINLNVDSESCARSICDLNPSLFRTGTYVHFPIGMADTEIQRLIKTGTQNFKNSF